MFLEKLNSICSSILQGFREYHFFIIPFLHMGSRQYYSTTNKFYNFIFTVVVAQHDSHHRKKAIKNYITAIMLSTKIHFSNLSRYYQTKKSVFTTLVGVLLSFSPSLAPQRRRLLNFLREEKRVGVGHTSIQGQQQQTFCLTGLPSRPSSSVHIHTRRLQTDGRACAHPPLCSTHAVLRRRPAGIEALQSLTPPRNSLRATASVMS